MSHAACGFRFGFLRRIPAEFREKIRLTRREESDVGEFQSLFAQIVNEHFVHAFKTDRTAFNDLGNMVAGREYIWIRDNQQRSARRAMNQVQNRFEYDNAGSFGTDQRTPDLKSLLGQERVEIVTGYAPRNARETLADQSRVLFA